MLILSRKVDERLVIAGGLITITVIEVAGNKVRLGIDAPPDVAIDREEIHALRKSGEIARSHLEGRPPRHAMGGRRTLTDEEKSRLWTGSSGGPDGPGSPGPDGGSE